MEQRGVKMIKNNEIEIRTDKKKMLVCTSVQTESGEVEIIKRDGKKEDRMSLCSFLSQIFGRPVTIFVK